jgi:hypothetical protein
MKRTSIALLLIVALSGCSSSIYRGSTGSVYGDGGQNLTGQTQAFLSLSSSTNAPQFVDKLTTALEDEGFVIVGEGVNPSGLTIRVEQQVQMKVAGWYFLMYMASLGVLPGRNDLTWQYDVEFLMDGRVVRSTDYSLRSALYITAFSPIGLFMGTSATRVETQVISELAADIAADLPAAVAEAEYDQYGAGQSRFSDDGDGW